MSSSFSTPHKDCGLCKITDICSDIKCYVMFICDISSLEIRFGRDQPYNEFNLL